MAYMERIKARAMEVCQGLASASAGLTLALSWRGRDTRIATTTQAADAAGPAKFHGFHVADVANVQRQARLSGSPAWR